MHTTLDLHIPTQRVMERVYALMALQSYSEGSYGEPLRRTPGTAQRPALAKALEGAAFNLAVKLRRHLSAVTLTDSDEITLQLAVEGVESVSGVTATMLLAMAEETLAYGTLELGAPMAERQQWASRAMAAADRLLAMLEPLTGLSLTPNWM